MNGRQTRASERVVRDALALDEQLLRAAERDPDPIRVSVDGRAGTVERSLSVGAIVRFDTGESQFLAARRVRPGDRVRGPIMQRKETT